MKDDTLTKEELYKEIVELRKKNEKLNHYKNDCLAAQENLRKAQEQWRSLVENLPDFIAIIDAKGLILYINKSVFGLEAKNIIGTSLYKYVEKENREALNHVIASVFNTGKIDFCELRIAANKEILWYNGYIIPIKEDGKISLATITASEITDRIRADEALKIERTRFINLLNQLPGFVYLQTQDYKIKFANKYFEELFGVHKDKTCYEIIHERSAVCKGCPTDNVFKDKTPQVWEWYNRRNNRIYQMYDYPFIDTDGSPLVLKLGIDITERKHIEEFHYKDLALQYSITKVSEASLSPEYDIKDIAGIILEQSLKLTDSKHGLVSIVDTKTEDNIAITLTDMIDKECNISSEQQRIIFPKGEKGYSSLLGHALNTQDAFYTNNPKGHEAFENCAPTGHIVIERFLSAPAVSAGKLIGQIAVANSNRDYTSIDLTIIKRLADVCAIAIDRKIIEEKLRKSLKEKELLLGEIHHRIKNNLAIVSSLLRMQRNNIKDEHYANMFKESENRIKSIALVHEKIYRSKSLSNVNLNTYIKDLIETLFETYKTNTTDITINISVDDLTLEIDKAIPFGLLINELIANALKYAFPNKEQGEIYIGLHRVQTGQIRLIVRDNGVGLPKSIDIRNTESLGFQLIVGLAENQLEGALQLNKNTGTEIIITFKNIDSSY
ncbi:signal transduction histidine kinase [Candidatus Magnetoovum chiemensis]|nr:signal transduction histidine kinase [Candidatus Magnetoovum chiemensis]